MNVVLIVVDSLRQDHVGAYGNPWIKTPHMDAFAKEAMMYTRCYPDSLPTLQVRRALHTGVRSWPFKDFVDPDNRINFPRNSGYPIAGWGPLSDEYDC